MARFLFWSMWYSVRIKESEDRLANTVWSQPVAILEIKNIRGVNMEYERIELPKELVKSIKVIVEKTRLFIEDWKAFSRRQMLSIMKAVMKT